ncbi:MAG TPA: RDD family protein [Solirubrobacteraceae bacterium]|nr:RDD family protein [Solirubrobacteraceae bacterium]
MSTAAPVPYAGLASRALALAVDAALVHLVVLTGGAVIALAASLVGDLKFDTVERLLAAWAWASTVCAYFVLFWTTTGQTPGMRLMQLRVVASATGERPGFWRSVLRLIGLGLAIIPLFAGFLPVLVDDRRRALQDFIAHTVVLYSDRAGTTWLAPAPAADERIEVAGPPLADRAPGH